MSLSLPDEGHDRRARAERDQAEASMNTALRLLALGKCSKMAHEHVDKAISSVQRLYVHLQSFVGTPPEELVSDYLAMRLAVAKIHRRFSDMCMR